MVRTRPSSSATTSRFSASHGVKSPASIAQTSRGSATRCSRPKPLLSRSMTAVCRLTPVRGRRRPSAARLIPTHQGPRPFGGEPPGREVYEQAGTDGPKAADEPVAHLGVVIAAERWQEVGLSKHHLVSPEQHDREEDANDPNDHSSLEERHPEKAVVLTFICWRLYH